MFNIFIRLFLPVIFLCIDSVDPEILLEIATQLSLPDRRHDALKRLPQALGLSLTEEECQQQQQKQGLRGLFLLMFLQWQGKRDLGVPADSELALILKQLGYDDLALSCEEDYLDIL